MSAFSAGIAPFLATWPIVDVALGMLWFRSVWVAWKGYERPKEADDVNERTLGATFILAQLNGALTTASIIIAGVGAFVALTPKSFNPYAIASLRLAAVFAVISLGSAVYTMATLPARSPHTNVVRDKAVALLSTIPLIFVTFAGIRFMFAIWTYLAAD